MTTHQPYQLFPELKPEEYAALKEDIANAGSATGGAYLATRLGQHEHGYYKRDR